MCFYGDYFKVYFFFSSRPQIRKYCWPVRKIKAASKATPAGIPITVSVWRGRMAWEGGSGWMVVGVEVVVVVVVVGWCKGDVYINHRHVIKRLNGSSPIS